MTATMERVERKSLAPGQLIARLKELSRKTGELLYERVKITAQLLGDKEWIATEFGGDDFKAADSLAATCLEDLAQLYTPHQLKDIYDAYPSKQEWDGAKYSLKTLWAMLVESRPKEEKHKAERLGPVPRKEFEKLVEEKKEAEYMVKRRDKDLAEKVQDLDAANKKIRDLEHTVATLQGRIQELERMAERRVV